MLNLFRPTKSAMPEALNTRNQHSSLDRSEMYKRSVRDHVLDYIVIALGGRLAAVDGQVNDAEVAALPRIFPLSRTTREHLRPLLIEASGDRTQVEHYARRLHTFFPENQKLYRDMIQGLFALASADGMPNVEEITCLREITRQFGLAESVFIDQLREVMIPKGTTPYQIMGVLRNVTEGELKTAYYKAVRVFHPDKLAYITDGGELVAIATARIKTIHQAYIAIKKQKKYR